MSNSPTFPVFFHVDGHPAAAYCELTSNNKSLKIFHNEIQNWKTGSAGIWLFGFAKLRVAQDFRGFGKNPAEIPKFCTDWQAPMTKCDWQNTLQIASSDWLSAVAFEMPRYRMGVNSFNYLKVLQLEVCTD